MKYIPKELQEEVNVTPVHPLVNFTHLLGTVCAAGAVIYVGLGIVAAQLSPRLSPALEAKLGDALMSTLLQEAELLSDRRVEYLQALTESLQPKALDPPVQVQILAASAPNAMVLPGGHLLVTTGLLDSVTTENELAFVLAHELGHLEAEDPLKGLGRSLVLLAFNSALGLSNVRVIQLLPIAGNLADLRHSRSQERAADRYALEVIVNHYGHGSRSLDFFEQLSQSELNWGALGSMAEWQSTHPLTPARLEQLKALAAAQNWPMEGEPTPLPARLHCADFADCEK